VFRAAIFTTDNRVQLHVLCGSNVEILANLFTESAFLMYLDRARQWYITILVRNRVNNTQATKKGGYLECELRQVGETTVAYSFNVSRRIRKKLSTVKPCKGLRK
jgi:hypothetical protein